MEEASFNSCLEKWRLVADPFEESFPLERGLYARPSEEIKGLKYLISRTAERSSVLNLVILGDYGSGKTYLMKRALSWLDETETKVKAVGLYIVVPRRQASKGFRDIYESIIRSIGIQRLSSIGRLLASKYDANGLDELASRLEDLVPSQDFARAVANLAFENDTLLSWTWLTGNATIHQDRALGMSSTPKNEDNALQIIISAFKVIAMYEGTIILFVDELENLVGRSRAVESIRDGIRNLYDELIYGKRGFGICIVSSVTAGYIEMVRESLGAAVFDRARRFSLSALDRSKAAKFVLCLINAARLSEDQEGPSPPFASEDDFEYFIETAFKMTRLLSFEATGEARTPRSLCKAGQSLLDYCCFQDIKEITSDVLDQWVQEGF